MLAHQWIPRVSLGGRSARALNNEMGGKEGRAASSGVEGMESKRRDEGSHPNTSSRNQRRIVPRSSYSLSHPSKISLPSFCQRVPPTDPRDTRPVRYVAHVALERNLVWSSRNLVRLGCSRRTGVIQRKEGGSGGKTVSSRRRWAKGKGHEQKIAKRVQTLFTLLIIRYDLW